MAKGKKKAVPLTITVGGKRFRRIFTRDTRREADQEATDLRREGWSVILRLVDGKWRVFIRRR